MISWISSHFTLKLSLCFPLPKPQDESMEEDEDQMMRHVLDCIVSLLRLQHKRKKLQSSKNKVFFDAIAQLSELTPENFEIGGVLKNIVSHLIILCFQQHENPRPEGSGSIRSLSWMPLHWIATGKGIHENDIVAVAQSYPHEINIGDGFADNSTPIHYAAAVRKPDMTHIRTLCNFFPRLPQTKDARGKLPLHYAAEFSESVEMVEFLLQENLGANVTRTTSLSRTPLHILVGREVFPEQVAMVKCLLEADNGAAALIVDEFGRTPLHIACHAPQCWMRRDCISALINANREATQVRDEFGRVPLHYFARRTTPPVQILEEILSASSNGAFAADADGRLPIHYAAQFSSMSTIAILAAANPASVSVNVPSTAEYVFGTPFHHATLSENANEEVIPFLYTLYPAAVTLKTAGRDWLPLHCVCSVQTASLQKLKMIYELHPAAIRGETSAGQLPLHLLIESLSESTESLSNCADKLRFLLRQHPAAVSKLDNNGDSCYTLALRRRLSPFLVRLLLNAQPDIDPNTLHQLNYVARRDAIFLLFEAVSCNVNSMTIWYKLRAHRDQGLIKQVLCFL